MVRFIGDLNEADVETGYRRAPAGERHHKFRARVKPRGPEGFRRPWPARRKARRRSSQRRCRAPRPRGLEGLLNHRGSLFLALSSCLILPRGPGRVVEINKRQINEPAETNSGALCTDERIRGRLIYFAARRRGGVKREGERERTEDPSRPNTAPP